MVRLQGGKWHLGRETSISICAGRTQDSGTDPKPLRLVQKGSSRMGQDDLNGRTRCRSSISQMIRIWAARLERECRVININN
jgi:hypothetical protein